MKINFTEFQSTMSITLWTLVIYVLNISTFSFDGAF